MLQDVRAVRFDGPVIEMEQVGETEDGDLVVETCITRTQPPALTLEHGLWRIKEAVEKLKLDPPSSTGGILRFQVQFDCDLTLTFGEVQSCYIFFYHKMMIRESARRIWLVMTAVAKSHGNLLKFRGEVGSCEVENNGRIPKITQKWGN